MTEKERYQSLKERGICVYCKSAPAEDGKTTCRVCREKQRKQTAEKRDALKKIGFCTECGKYRIYGNETLCPECATKKYIDNRNRRINKSQEEIEKEREHAKEVRRKLIEDGICVKCRKRSAEKGKTRCQICNIQERNRMRKNRGGIMRSERPAYGLCYFCGNKILKGNICDKCKERIIKNLPKESHPNEHWRKAEYSRIEEVKNQRRGSVENGTCYIK